MIATVLLVISAFGLTALLAFGGRAERVAAVLIIANIVSTPFLEPFKIGEWRAGLAVLETVLFLALWAIVEIRGRWWLTAAAGLQLIVVLSHLLALSGAYFIWTAVSIRIGAAGLMSLTFFVGAWEAWADRRFAREARTHENSLDF